MTKLEKDTLIAAIDSFNENDGDYYDLGYLDGLVVGLNLRRGNEGKICIVNGMTLYEGKDEIYRYGGGSNEEVLH